MVRVRVWVCEFARFCVCAYVGLCENNLVVCVAMRMHRGMGVLVSYVVSVLLFSKLLFVFLYN